MTTLPAFGLTMNQATPARCAPPSGLIAVSSAPHNLPFAYITCCMRVSFESGVEITSLCAGSLPNKSRQQPTAPLNSGVVVSLIQYPCGVSTVAGVPEPGCCCLGGIAYWFTPSTLLLRLMEGEALFSEEVLANVQTISWDDVWVPPKPVSNWVPGDCAGQTVKPGCVEPASLGTFTMPDVSMCTNVTWAAFAASCALEKA